MMKHHRRPVCFALLCIGCAGLTSSYASDDLGVLTSNGQFNVILPESSATNELRMVEWSTNLVDWLPVARDYGTDWENTFPYALPVSTGGVNQILSDPTDEPQRFYRVVNTATASLNNTNSVARFLQQATFGPTRDLINNFPGLTSPDLNEAPYTNYLAWIEAQLAGPTNSHRAFFRERSNTNFVDNPANMDVYEVGFSAPQQQLTYNGGSNNSIDPDPADVGPGLPVNDLNFSRWELHHVVWYQRAMEGDDVLRQRMAWALSQIIVTGQGATPAQAIEKWLKFYDIFVRHAFGNYRDILEEVTYSYHMGGYLTYLWNQKADPVAGTFPDENYTREVMQLFTIGLWELNQDGTPVLDINGNLIPTYTIDDIADFARIFTGLRPADNIRPALQDNIERVFADYNPIDPLRTWKSAHDFAATNSLLDGSMLGPFTSSDANLYLRIDTFLDHLIDHPSAPPFISRKLIQRLTVSNPSPTYIYDVAQAFIDGEYDGVGSGVRGDLGAVIKAILLHPEAREPSLSYDAAHGKLREPLVRFLSYARAFELTSNQTFGFYPFYKLDEIINQAPFESPSVFNFYLPDYQPNGVVLDRDLFSPEFQIHNDITALNLPNTIKTLIYDGIKGGGGVDTPIGQRSHSQGDLDLTYEIALAGDATALVNHLDTMVTAGRLTSANRATIEGVINGMPDVTANDLEERAKAALWLFTVLPEFNVMY